MERIYTLYLSTNRELAIPVDFNSTRIYESQILLR